MLDRATLLDLDRRLAAATGPSHESGSGNPLNEDLPWASLFPQEPFRAELDIYKGAATEPLALLRALIAALLTQEAIDG